MIFNGFDFSGLVHVEDIRTTLTPDVVWQTRRISGSDGLVLGKRTIRERLIEIDIRLIEDSRIAVTDKAAQVAGRLITDKPAKLVTRRDAGRWWMAVYQGSPELKQLFETGFATLEFLVPGGMAYSDEQTAELTAGSNTVTVTGTRETMPVYEISLSAATDTVTIGALELKKSDGGTWPAGAVIKVDTRIESESVTIDEINAMKHILIGSRWPILAPGENTVSVTGGSGTVRWNPRWV